MCPALRGPANCCIFSLTFFDVQKWHTLQFDAINTLTLLLKLSNFVCMPQPPFQFRCLASFPCPPVSAMAPCVEVILSWAIGGGEVQRWQQVRHDSFLEDVVTEEFLDALPGQLEVLHGQKRLQRPLHIEVGQCMSSQDVVLLGLVRTHTFKDEDCDLVPYLCLDGVNAVRVHELGVRFAFSKNAPERFSHAFKAMTKQFQDKAETDIRRQVFDLMKRALPGCVLRRKMDMFFSEINGDDSPLTIQCVLVLNARGELLLRMDLRPFTMVDDEVAAAVVKTVVNSIYKATFF